MCLFLIAQLRFQCLLIECPMINTMHRSMLSSTDRNSDGDNPIMKQLKRTIICIWLCAVLSACVPATSQPASDASFNEEAVTVLTVRSEMTPAAIQLSPNSSAPSTVEGSVLPTSLPSPSAALITPTSAMSTPTPAADDGGIDFFDFCDMPQIIPPGAAPRWPAAWRLFRAARNGRAWCRWRRPGSGCRRPARCRRNRSCWSRPRR